MITRRHAMAAGVVLSLVGAGAAFTSPHGSSVEARGDHAATRPRQAAGQRSQAPGAITGLVLSKPLQLGVLAPLLEQAQLVPIEFSYRVRATEVVDPPPELQAMLDKDNVAVAPPPQEIVGGFEGAGLPLAQQVDEFRASYQADYPGKDPVVYALVLEGAYERDDLGPLAAHVARIVSLPLP